MASTLASHAMFDIVSTIPLLNGPAPDFKIGTGWVLGKPL
jgi:hypothetical protein